MRLKHDHPYGKNSFHFRVMDRRDPRLYLRTLHLPARLTGRARQRDIRKTTIEGNR